MRLHIVVEILGRGSALRPMLGRHWLHYIAVGGVTLALTLGFSFDSDSYADEPNQILQPSKRTKEKVSETQPLPITIPGGVEIKESPAGEQRQTAESKRAAADLKAQQDMAFAARSQAGISLLGLIGLGLTVFYARRAWNEARRAANASIEAAKHGERSARAAESSVSHAQDTATRQLRAYLGIEAIAISPGYFGTPYVEKISSAPGVTAESTLRIAVKNFGQTPARDVLVFGYWLTTDYATRLPYEFFAENYTDRFSQVGVRNIYSRYVLNSGQIHVTGIPVWDPAPWREAFDKKRTLYVYGRIYYVDAFKCPWRTTFCYFWEPDENMKFTPYEYYNGEDDRAAPKPG